MPAVDSDWLKPEEALTRFKRPDISFLDFEAISRHEIKKRYGFIIGNLGMILPDGTLSEVMKMFEVFPVPNTEKWFKGMTNVRGNLVPVYDLSMMLGYTDETAKFNNLLVLDKGAGSIGILMNNLPRPYEVSVWKVVENRSEIPSAFDGFVDESYEDEGIVWACIDHKRFFESIKSAVAT